MWAGSPGGSCGGGGNERVQAFDRFLVADAEAGLIAGQAIDLRSCIAPGDTEEHVGDMTLVTGAVIDWVEFMEEITGGVGEGVLLEGQLTIEVEESGFGANEVLEANFAEGDFEDGDFLEWGLGEEVVDVPCDAIGDLPRSLGVVVERDIVGTGAVLQGVE